MAPNKCKQYCARLSKNDFKKLTENKQNYFVLPSPVSIPKYPIPIDLIPVVSRNLRPSNNMTVESIMYLSILEQIKNNDVDLNASNYLKILKLMLYLEHIQNDIDMKRYNQNNKKIERIFQQSKIFKIPVDGLAEDRPSIRPEDIVEVRNADNKMLYLLRVTSVQRDHIIVVSGKNFSNHFNSEKSYNVKFRYPDYTIRCSHHALTLTNIHQLSQHFFPERRESFSSPSTIDFWFNKTIENNPQQKQAVKNIVSRSSFPAPYILFGPPGTGKTATVVEAICQIYNTNSMDTHILVCTPSNSAADMITKRLLYYEIPEQVIYRMYSPSKEGSKIEEAIVGCSNYVEGQVMMLPEELVKTKSIVICTLCAATRLLFMNFKEKHFSYIFIDEAGQAIEPDTLIPFNLLTSVKEGRIGRLHGQVILAGDPNQLGPTIMSKLAEPILGRSLLERLMESEPYKRNEHHMYNPNFITKLIRNYRSHPDLIRVSNTLFYDDELIPCADNSVYRAEDWEYLEKAKFPIIFHGTTGMERTEPRSPSIFNMTEVNMVIDYVKRLVGHRLKGKEIQQSDIGIITPFSEQRIKIHNALGNNNYNNVDVGTVELFQGQERDIIIISTVRSKIFEHDQRYHIGFLSNAKRFNVALTRAKALLIVIGNPNILKVDIHWRYFLNYCKENKVCRGTKFTIEENINEQIHHMFRKNLEKKQSKIKCDFDFIEIDNGVMESSDSSIVDEDEYPATNRNINGKQRNDLPTSQNMLSNLVMQKLSEMEIGSSNTSKKKRKKK